jgi:plastocyanin
MTKTGWIVVVIVIAVLIGGFLLMSSNATAPAVDQGAASNVQGGDSLDQSIAGPDAMDGATFDQDANSAAMTASVTYDGKTFSPSEVRIKKGGTVTFTDTTGGTMWVASAMHPGHEAYDGTTRSAHCASGYTGAAPFDQCAKGSSYSFKFEKVGEFPYHDHITPTVFGKVVVVE